MSNDLNSGSGFSAAELVILSGAFATIAEGIGTLAAALAIQEAQQLGQQHQQQHPHQQSASTPSNQQRQIDQIQRDIRAIKQMLNAKGAQK